MTAQSLILPNTDGAELRRWAFAAAFVVTAHVAAVGGYFLLAPDEDAGMSEMPPVLVDMTQTVSSSPSLSDAKPGEEMDDVVPTPKPEEIKPEQIAEPVEKVETQSDVTLPSPERKVEEQKQQEQQVQQTAAAPPKAEQLGQQRLAAAPQGSNASRDATVRWNHLLSARLRQNTRYPAAGHGENGAVTVSFVVNSKGAVLSQRIVRSSGHPTLDNEALAMLQRSQPLPAFLPGMPNATEERTQTISYNAPK